MYTSDSDTTGGPTDHGPCAFVVPTEVPGSWLPLADLNLVGATDKRAIRFRDVKYQPPPTLAETKILPAFSGSRILQLGRQFMVSQPRSFDNSPMLTLDGEGPDPQR